MPSRPFDAGQLLVIGLVAEIFFTITTPLAVGAFTGWWFDHLFGTSPWLLFASFPCALAATSALIRRKGPAWYSALCGDEPPAGPGRP